MPHSRLLAGLAVLACPLLLGGRDLPGFALPQGRLDDIRNARSDDLIPYRPLSRSDFKAPAPPAHLHGHETRVGAATCASISVGPRTRLIALPVKGPGEAPAFEARLTEARFEARMDRACSWWNRASRALPEAYVLEHEQIHFAVFEIEARRMTARGPEIVQRTAVVAPTAREALEAANQKITEELEKALARLLARSRAFDEDTSRSYAPAAQRMWRARVEKELGESDPAKAP